MDIWMIWIIAGILCMIIEIFSHGFLFMSFGISAILIGILAAILILSNTFQVILFLIIAVLVFLFLRKNSGKMIKVEEQAAFEMPKKRKGVVTKDIPPDGKGYIKADGKELPAMSRNNVTIEKGQLVIITNISDDGLIVKKRQ